MPRRTSWLLNALTLQYLFFIKFKIDLVFERVPRTSMENIVVIGACIVGLSCAYNFLNSGQKVTLLERVRPGCGQSTRTGGGIRYLHET